MKRLLLVLALLPLTNVAQTSPATEAVAYPRNAKTGLVDYADVVPVEGVAQAELFARARRWLAGSFKPARDVAQIEDKEAGLLMGKGYLPITLQSGRTSVPYKLYYTLKLNCKESRYRYELTDFYFENEPSAASNYKVVKNPVENMLFGMTQNEQAGRALAEYRRQFDKTVPTLLAGLKAAMLKPSDF